MPDYLAFRRAYYNDLLHVGKGHDDNPPGRGSGRYPYGSGERPFQGEIKNLSKEKYFSLTDEQKKFLKVGMVFVGSALILYGGYRISKSMELRKLASSGREIIDSILTDDNSGNKGYVDGFIKKGTKLQTLAQDQESIFSKKYIFASFTKFDNERYVETLGKKKEYNYKITLNTLKDIKVADRENGSTVFKEMFKENPNFREYIFKTGRSLKTDRRIEGRKILFREPNTLTDKEISDLYNFWNVMLSKNTPSANIYKDIFFNRLKERGFGAVFDLNDMLYSDIQTKNPVLIFDSDLYSVEDIKRIVR